MNRTQALDMATRIRDTWNARWSDVATDAWAEDLEPLDHGQALAAVRRLRRTLDKVPTLAQFLAEIGATTQDRYEVSHCGRCSGNGWVDGGTETRDLGRGLTLAGPVVRRCPDCRGRRRPIDPPEFVDA